tara:strand:- start:1743 stop:1961 length:219 start_codon:yes stop_codon:yes gene_type:complete
MSEDIRQPTNKTLIEEVLLEIRQVHEDISKINNDLKEIHRYIAIQHINDEKLQQGKNLEPTGFTGGSWWSPF